MQQAALAYRDQRELASTDVNEWFAEAGASRLRAANSSTATISSRVTSNHSIISSIFAPDSKFSNTVATGIRVSLNTQAPLRLPGTLSTAGHCDQSRLAIFASLPFELSRFQGTEKPSPR